jgi:hypothetical protein
MRILLTTLCLLIAPLADAFEGRVTFTVREGRNREETLIYSTKDNRVRIEGAKSRMGGAMVLQPAEQRMLVMVDEQQAYMVLPFDQVPVSEEESSTDIRIERTGRTETILGYLCEELRIIDGSTVTEVWVTDKLGTFFSGSTSGMPGANRSQSRAWERAIAGREGFFPLRIISRSGERESFRMEARSVEPGRLADALFIPPPDYVEFQLPPSMRGILGR